MVRSDASARRSLRRLGLTLLFCAAILGGALVGVLLAGDSELPQVSSLEEYQPNLITQVFAADGSLLGEFAIEKRVVVSFESIPPVLRNAIVAVEDGEFWQHLGINPWSIPRAVIANLRSGSRGQGFSTLTMQLSRVLFLTPEKTYGRKLKEIILAFQIEKSFTKEEIFTLYCNQVYFGHGNYGVEATSRFLFGKSVAELSLAEAALIAGLPQNPALLSPVNHPERAAQRRSHVLDRMVAERYISAAEAEQARQEPLSLRLRRPPPSMAPYFLEEVRKQLEQSYGSQRIYQGGLRVHTTLDPSVQRAANRALRDGLLALDREVRGFVPPTESVLVDGALPDDLHLDDWDRPAEVGSVLRGVVVESGPRLALVRLGELLGRVEPPQIAWTGQRNVDAVLRVGSVAPFRVLGIEEKPDLRLATLQLEQEPEIQGSLLALDVSTGDVRAMVGGYDFERSKFNRGTQAMRQVGSAFKPIVYAATIEKLGWTPATVLVDAPLSYPDVSAASGVWEPQNYDFAFLGPVTLREALEQSRNLPAVRALQAVGVEAGIEYAARLGLSRTPPPYLPVALGASEATLAEMTSAFACFANQGIRMAPRLVTRVLAADGNVVEQPGPRAHDAIRADTAYLLTSLLRGVVERGTARRARSLERPIAGKTGTTNDWTDAWFIGFEPDLAAGVWVGFDDKRRSLGKGRDGGSTALPIWMDFWREARADAAIERFAVPGNIVFVPLDPTGRPTRAGAPSALMEAFIAGTEPGAGGWPTAASPREGLRPRQPQGDAGR